MRQFNYEFTRVEDVEVALKAVYGYTSDHP